MLQISNLSVRLGGKQILQDIHFDLQPGRLTALVGRNGSGKSTLLACVNQQLSYTGTICYNRADLSGLAPMERAKRIAYLPQTMPSPQITGRELVAFGRNPYVDFTGRLTAKDWEMVDDALREADAKDLAARYVSTLSGGERQRVAMAMILAQDTPVALLDEPTAHMDPVHETAFLRKLCQLRREKGKTFLIALHDLNLAVEFADDILLLDGGKLVFAGSKQDCLAGQVLEKNFSLRRYTFQAENKIFFATDSL